LELGAWNFKGMIFLFTGSGKGKTTAALGQALRAIGNKKKVLIIQFIKSPEWKTGEIVAVERFEPDLKMVQMGKGFVGILGNTLPREEHVAAAQEAFSYAKTEFSTGAWDILILDEINVALHLELLPREAVVEFIKSFPKEKDLILTGRWAPDVLYQCADYVTEMQDIKHPFEKGVQGKRGTEW
jgi:cob(I)alamin adenosyltransferase